LKLVTGFSKKEEIVCLGDLLTSEVQAGNTIIYPFAMWNFSCNFVSKCCIFDLRSDYRKFQKVSKIPKK